MPETTPEPKSSKANENPSPKAHEPSSPEAAYGLEAHDTDVRHQLMRQWPSQDWERR